MSFSTKWHLRQMALEVISYVLCFTTILIAVPIAVKAYKFYEYGLGAYPEYRWPRSVNMYYCLQQFWQLTLYPMLCWVPFTATADVVLRRFVYRLRS